MSPTRLHRFKKKPRLAKHSMAVLYVELNGCIHTCLPFFVDSLGGCHISLDDDQASGALGVSSSPPHRPPPNSPTEPSDEDMYIDRQLAEMRELEGHKIAMNCHAIFEEIIIRARESSFLHSKMPEEEEHRRMMLPVLHQVVTAVAARESRMAEKRIARNELNECVLKDTAKPTKEEKRAKKNGKSAANGKTVCTPTERENLIRELFGDGHEAPSSKMGQANRSPSPIPCAFSPRETTRRPKLRHFQLQQPKVVY